MLLALTLALIACHATVDAALLTKLSTPEQLDSDSLRFTSMPVQQRGGECSRAFPEFDPIIESHLQLWREHGGISFELILATIHNHTMRTRRGRRDMGVAVGFRQGQAVLLDIPRLQDTMHWPGVLYRQLEVLLDLQEVFGDTLPDVDMVIALTDASTIVKSPDRPGSEPPVMRYSRQPSVNPDIPVPCVHSYVMGLNALVKGCLEFNAKHAWRNRRTKALARYTLYERRTPCSAPAALRLGPGGSNSSCEPCNPHTGLLVCQVRKAFSQWATERHPTLLDVSHPNGSTHFVPMPEQARWKYLVHIDGIGLSSKLEQALPLGSLIFKEESGFEGYLYPLLKPYEHYVPFWKEVPEELLGAMRWAHEHDAEAQRLALNGQVFAQSFMTRKARACYWFKLLHAYAKLLRYAPGEQRPQAYMEVPGGDGALQDGPLGAVQAFDLETQALLERGELSLAPGQWVGLQAYAGHLGRLRNGTYRTRIGAKFEP